MHNFELISFANADELARTVAGKWLDEIAAAKRAGKRHCVALSGGRIARKFFASVVEQAKARKIGDGDTPSLPGNVHFFWADERCVPPDDVESNFKLANELLFLPLKIAEAQIHRIQGELPPDKAAELATAEIRRVTLSSPSPPQKEERAGVRRPIVSNSNPLTPPLSPLGRGEGVDFQPILDLIFLGMGEDGHVASLFPGEPGVSISDNAIYRAVKNSPKPPSNRVTLGYAVITMARQVWVLVSGTGKEVALRESLFSKGRTPLARVTQFRTRTKIFSDFPLIKNAQNNLTNY
jgi:6-phosphogluconolactonase